MSSVRQVQSSSHQISEIKRTLSLIGSHVAAGTNFTVIHTLKSLSWKVKTLFGMSAENLFTTHVGQIVSHLSGNRT